MASTLSSTVGVSHRGLVRGRIVREIAVALSIVVGLVAHAADAALVRVRGADADATLRMDVIGRGIDGHATRAHVWHRAMASLLRRGWRAGRWDAATSVTTPTWGPLGLLLKAWRALRRHQELCRGPLYPYYSARRRTHHGQLMRRVRRIPCDHALMDADGRLSSFAPWQQRWRHAVGAARGAR